MINKLFPRILNPSADARVRKPTDMIDALNVSVGTDFDSASDGDNSGDVGVLKPARSNTEVEKGNNFTADFVEGVIPDSGGVIANQRVIGSVTDDVMGIIFFFVWSNVPNEMGVYAYDRNGVLPNTSPNSYTRVFNTSYFNFQSTSFVKGDVVHFGKPYLSYDKTIVLYFTDNINEPRKLDVFRAMTIGQGIEDYNEDDTRDFITACPKTPVAPITFRFSVDQSRNVSNFTKVPGMQFAYQNIYKDGSESAVSTYSLLAIPPTYTSSGTEIPSIIPENVCILTIPRMQGDQIIRTRDIEAVRILVRFGEAGVLKVIDEIDIENFLEDIEYNFFNDRVLIPIPQNEQNKLFSNLPRRAQAQAIASDRLIYANYLDGYDNVPTLSDIEAHYKELPDTILDIDVKLNEFIIQPTAHNSEDLYGRNRISGYALQAMGVPELIPAGSTFNVNFVISPAENFHVYDQTRSFHANAQTANVENYVEEDDVSANYFESNNVPDYTLGKSYFGDNAGVTYDFNESPLKWNYYHDDTDGVDAAFNSVSASFGTSASNPLILKGPDALQYELQFTVSEEVNSGVQFIEDIVAKLLSDQPVPDSVDVEILNNVDTYNLNCNLSGDVDNLSAGVDYRKNLIVGVKDGGQASGSNLQNQAPCGYFIVNEASVSVGFKNYTNEAVHFDGLDYLESNGIIGLDIKNISNINVRTCIPLFQRKGYMGETIDQSYTSAQFSTPTQFKGTDIAQNTQVNNWNYWSDNYISSENAPNAIFENLSIKSWRTFSRDYIATTAAGNWKYSTSSPGNNNSSVTPSLQGLLDGAGSGNADGSGEHNTISNVEVYENVLWYPNDNVPKKHIFRWLSNKGSNGWSQYSNAICETEDYTMTGVWSSYESRKKCAGYLSDSSGSYVSPIKLMAYSSEREEVAGNLYSSFSLLDGEGVFNSYDAYKRGFEETTANITNGSINGNVVWNGHIKSWICHKIFNYSKESIGPNFTGLVNNLGVNSIGLNTDPQTSSNINLQSRLSDSNGNAAPERRLIQPPLLKFFSSPQETLNVTGGGNIGPSPGNDNNQAENNANNYLDQLQLVYDQSLSNASINSQLEGVGESPTDGFTAEVFRLSYDSLSTNQGESFVGLSNSYSTSVLGNATTEFRSFKTKANHEFGIVYYDERGRSGNVNYLGNLYVGGYNNEERGANKGRVEVGINLQHDPPEWAKNYQIVYAGNTSVEDFIQYSTGSAFIDTQNATPTEFTEQDSLIYVSLNHLQGDSGISYVSGFGAVNKDGGKDMYVYSAGDKLRIVSYIETDGETRTYPKDYSFDVVGVKTFNALDNPFVNDDATASLGNEQDSPESDIAAHPSKIGQFIVLRDNSDAQGFTYSNILNSYETAQGTLTGVNGSTSEHLWNNRTIVEIFSPKKSADADDRIYFEIGECYNIVDQDGVRVHEENPITIQRGDVFWRRVPVNLPDYNSDLGVFESIMKEEGQTTKFKNFYLETQTFSDLFPFTDVTDFAKPKIIIQDAGGLHRRASLTYSDKNNYNGKFNKFASFNNSLLNFKDIPNEYGAINFIMNNYDSILVIQENKTSVLPVSRNIISTAAGVESLTTSKEVLGTQKFYAGDYGCDNNPESVVKAGTNVYFANKSAREVYRFNASQGIEVISEQGMKKFFRNLFRDAMINAQNNDSVVRVASGYDPLNDEYIISVNTLQNIPNLDAEPATPEEIDETIGRFEEVINEQEELIGDQSDTIDGLEEEIDDLQDTINELQNQIASTSNGDGTFSITPEKYKSILQIVGPKLTEIVSDGNVFDNRKLAFDTNSDGSIASNDMLDFLSVYGNILPNQFPTLPIVKISDDPDAIASSDSPNESIAIVEITEE